jgi:post-segregation antitoxin (ccd killing protein)
MFVEDIISKENKRNKKQCWKAENKEMKDRVNITKQLTRGRDKKSNWIEYLGYRFDA